MRQSISAFLLLPLFSVTSAFAAPKDVRIVGADAALVPMHASPFAASAIGSEAANFKKIQLMKIELSPAAQQQLAAQLNEPTTANDKSDDSLPNRASVSMANYPVLDQGQHGTCVTFANTGALDAAYNKPDYISQLCNLELGSTLAHEHPISYPSGWDGSYSEIVLKQIQDYGVISKSYQQQYGCAGRFEYPLDNQDDDGAPMTVQDFTQHSEMILQSLSYKMLLVTDDAFSVNRKKLLTKVKAAIANGDRVVVSMLVDTNNHDVGAYGHYKTASDSWIITPAIADDMKKGRINAGHAVIITGYDDKAVIQGPKNATFKGVITLRNSWSDQAGDHGDYYMSYDYFTKLVTELAEIVPAGSQS